MIIDHLTNDIQTLKACSLTCYSWYIVAAPRIHRTFVFKGDDNIAQKRLSNRHALGLLPLVKELRVVQLHGPKSFPPQSFRSGNLRHFFAFTNIQSLSFDNLDIQKFIPRLDRYFGHLSPALRSLTIHRPRCTPLQLSHFISLFPNLDDIEVQHLLLTRTAVHDEPLPPFSAPKLRGKLSLSSSSTTVATWEHLAASSGLRFRFILIGSVPTCAPILFTACAETLETFQIQPGDESGMCSPT